MKPSFAILLSFLACVAFSDQQLSITELERVQKLPGSVIELRWRANPCAISYRIERTAFLWREYRPGAGHNFQLLPYIVEMPAERLIHDGDWLLFRDFSVKAEATYNYCIQAVSDDRQVSPWSKGVQVGFMFPWP